MAIRISGRWPRRSSRVTSSSCCCPSGGERYLDRALAVPAIGHDPALAFFGDRP